VTTEDPEVPTEPSWVPGEGDTDGNPVTVLRRWEEAGALWRVLVMQADVTVIGLFTCDGGEQVGRLRCEPRAVADFLRGRVSSDEPSGEGTAEGRLPR
jgi:hypothetical protein